MANASSNTNAPASVANQFSLLPAIFTPFHGLPSANQPSMSRDEKLLVILEKLDQHQDEVRRSMMFLVAQHKARLVEEAKEALRRERMASGRRRWSYDKDASAPDEPEIQDLLRRLRTPVRPGASPRDYEYKPGDLEAAARSVGVGGAANDNEGDAHAEMPSREAVIRATLDEDLRNLVRRATAEMKNYDAHARQTKNHYRQALLRSATSDWSHALSADAALPAAGGGPVAGGGGPDAAAAARKGGGILVNKNAELFVDTQALARMATDESGSPTQARRGSGDGMKDLRRW